jgi:hypothetical protein
MARINWTPEMIEATKTRYQSDGPTKLAREFGMDAKDGCFVVARMARKLGVKQKRVNSFQPNIHCNSYYFHEWSPNMAYILGFIFADGSVDAPPGYLLRVGVVVDDEEVIQFIKEELKSKKELYYIPATVNKYGTSTRSFVRLSISDRVLVRRLMELGVKYRKTYNDDPFPEVPDEMIPHFVRGVLDGDGCTSCGVSFVGSPKFITGLKDALVRLAGMANKEVIVTRGKTTNYATVCWQSTKNKRLFHSFVYPDDTCFHLKRKKANLDNWLATHKEVRARNSWTPEEEEIVKNNYPEVSLTELGRRLNRDKTDVLWRTRKLGIWKRRNMVSSV